MQHNNYLYNRMYSNAERRNKPNNKNNVFDIAEQICQQTEGKKVASEIMNAYRKVEGIKITGNISNNTGNRNKEQKVEIKKPQSMYAIKVKETLKQLNANRKKQAESNKEIIPRSFGEEPKNKIGNAEKHLIQSGLKRLFKLTDKKYDAFLKEAFANISKTGNSLYQQQQQTIRLWRLRRVFSGWQYQVMLSKIEKQRVQKMMIQEERKKLKWAAQFNQFVLYRKIFKNWKQQTKRALKKRQLQLQQAVRRQEQLNKLQQQKKLQQKKQIESKKQIQPNVELQNKLKGFLAGLKQQIQDKNRINTIKQNTEEQSVKQEENQQNNAAAQNNQNQCNQDNANIAEQNHQDENQNQNQEDARGPLTNQDLQKKRKQLEKKAKQRKQALEKLKKERQQKKKQEQEQKLALEKQIEEQQKKTRQQQYKKFMKQKRQQQEWRIKEKQLQRQAIQFDRLRVIRYYGWESWKQLKSFNNKNAEYMSNLLTKIMLKRKLQKLTAGILFIGQQKLRELQQKINLVYKRKLLKKCVNKLRVNKNWQLKTKQQLTVRHDLSMLKIFFMQWQRARSTIQLQNYEWERPRMKKAENLHSLSIMSKAFEGLKINKQEEIENRNVEQHKAKIKQKLHVIVTEKPTINYDQFL